MIDIYPINLTVGENNYPIGHPHPHPPPPEGEGVLFPCFALLHPLPQRERAGVRGINGEISNTFD